MRETEKAGRLTLLPPRTTSQAAQKGPSAGQESSLPPGPSLILTPGGGSWLSQLTSDGLVFLLLFFGFALIGTEVIWHFKRSKGLGSLMITQHLLRFRWCLPFPSSPEVKSAARAPLLRAPEAEEGHGRETLASASHSQGDEGIPC